MTQRSFFWNGTTVGDADTYTKGRGYHTSVSTYESPLHDRLFRAVWNGTGNRGVLYGWTNELEVTGAATPISINTGAAIVYGLYYENNTAAVTKAIATPVTDRRYDRVVVRRNWTTQTARIHVITGVEGADIPSLVQSPAPGGLGIYDIPLATLMVATDGTITRTDDREYCTFSTTMTSTASKFTNANFADDSITFAQRGTREKLLFFGGGDFEPNVVPGIFIYGNTTNDTDLFPSMASVNGTQYTQAGPPTWGGAADTEAWKMASGTTGGLYITFALPEDYVTNTHMTSHIWWVNNATTSTSGSLFSAYHIYRYMGPNSQGPTEDSYSDYYGWFSGYYSSSISASTKNKVYRTTGMRLYGLRSWCREPITYFVAATSLTGSESIGIMGVEFRYTGYT